MMLDLFVPRRQGRPKSTKWFFLRVSQKFHSSSVRKILSRILSFVQPTRLIEVVKKRRGKNWIRFFDHIFAEKYNMSTTFSCTGGFTRKLVFRRIIRKMRRKLQNWSSKYGNWGRDKSSERDICRGSATSEYRDLGPWGIISFDRPISFHQPRHPAHYARGIRTVHGVYMEAWINRWTIYALSDHLILIVISARDFTGRASLGYPRKYES